MMFTRIVFMLLSVFFMGSLYTPVFANTVAPFSPEDLGLFRKYLFNNITTETHRVSKLDQGRMIWSIPGAVLASPSRLGSHFSQDYQFHWTRDAAITMNQIIDLYLQATPEGKQFLRPYLLNYVNFERKAQKQPSRHGEQTLGQPKFNIDGTVWEGEWGRPQNDGPALRAIAMMRIADALSQEKGQQWVNDQLLDVITADLDYIAREWHNSNYDLWEEVNDVDHFFTKMIQRKSLLIGSELMHRQGDPVRGNLYYNTAHEITSSLENHWNERRGYFSETVNQQYYKGGGLNSSIVLGVVHGSLENPSDRFAVNNDRVMSSVFYIRNAFSGLYRVNIDHPDSTPLIGRYPNDIYDGDQFEYGNPWVLTTSALAQYYYELAAVYKQMRQIKVTQTNLIFFRQLDPAISHNEETITLDRDPARFYNVILALTREGDRFLSSIKRYAVCYADNTCDHFAEQVDRTTGAQVSAKDLTWGYISLLAAMQARETAVPF